MLFGSVFHHADRRIITEASTFMGSGLSLKESPAKECRMSSKVSKDHYQGIVHGLRSKSFPSFRSS